MGTICSITLIFQGLLFNPPIIQGVVVDRESNNPISYVSIGIINTPYGTYSSESGRFEMELVNYLPSDSLRFSCIGYHPVTFKIDEFLARNNNGQDTIFLTSKVAELEEVVIYSSRYKVKTIGNKLTNKRILLGFIKNMERGIIIENNKLLYLNNVSFRLSMNGQQVPDSAIFRFNIYNIKDGVPDENILNQPIYFNLTNDEFNGTNEFDISKYNISVDEDFAATFELIRQYGGGRIYFTGWLSGRSSVRKVGKQGAWIDVKSDNSGTKLHQSLKIDVLYEK